MSNHTYEQLLLPGRNGDEAIQINLTARQVAIGQLLIEAALEYGVGGIVLDAVADVLGEDRAERTRLEFDISQKRIGIAMCRALGDDAYASQLTAELAGLDGEVAEL